MPLDSDVNLKDIAKMFNGYTGADIKSLSREAAMKSIRRYLSEVDLANRKEVPSEILNSIRIQNSDFTQCDERNYSNCFKRILCRTFKYKMG